MMKNRWNGITPTVKPFVIMPQAGNEYKNDLDPHYSPFYADSTKGHKLHDKGLKDEDVGRYFTKKVNKYGLSMKRTE